MDLNKNESSIEQRAKVTNVLKSQKKLVTVLISAIASLITLVYVASVMYTRFGGFSISVNKYHQLQYGLSLSETKDFISPTSMLNCRASEIITCIDGTSIDNNAVCLADGNNSKDNYLAYTFYCKNTGRENMDYDYSILITNMSLDIEKAVRVRVITKLNDEAPEVKTYAWAKTLDDIGNVIPEEGTIPFYSSKVVLQDTVENSSQNDILKFTVVIWLEGNDKDCVDDIIGGEFQIDMKFNMISVNGEKI